MPLGRPGRRSPGNLTRRCASPFGWRVRLVAAVLAGAVGCAELPTAPPRYAGSAACGECHPSAVDAWRGSLHARAALPADRAQAPADGRPDGATLVLGHAAVEQFLVPARGGRLQAFPRGFDPVAREWFEIFPEAPPPDDWTHWTQPGATANSQCLECHMTGYEKGYDPAAGTYASRWDELGVGCEACHGPGIAHVTVRRAGRDAIDPYTSARSAMPGDDVCMPCHSLRVPIAAGYEPGQALADHFDVELLDHDGLYVDGQLRGEAYEWTGFAMSRMAAAGVGCGGCHDAHTGALYEPGNALCLRCHPAELASEVHTRHPPGPGAECVGCHMPEHVFMERDRRRDHSITRPDPRRSQAIGAPDACTVCHRDRDQEWAAERVDALWGSGEEERLAIRALAVLLEAGRNADPAATAPLVRLLDSEVDWVRRASIARFLAPMSDRTDVVVALTRATRDENPFVAAAAVRSLGDARPPPSVDVLVDAARHPTRLVRLEAAFALASHRIDGLEPVARQVVRPAWESWLDSQRVMAELPEAHFNEALFWEAREEPAEAEAAYRRAIARWSADETPRQNLAMLLLTANRPHDAERELRAILERTPEYPPALVGLGLVYRSQERWKEAADAFERCVRVAPGYPHAALRLGEARLAAGDEDAALAAYEIATNDPESRREALRELVRIAYRRQDRALADRWLPEALLADPGTAADPAVREALGVGPGS